MDNSDSYFSSSLASSCYTLSDKKGNRAIMFVDRCAVFCSSLAQITESLELGYLSFIKHFSGFTRMTFNPCLLLKATGVLSLVLVCRRPTWDVAAGTAWNNAAPYVNIYR